MFGTTVSTGSADPRVYLGQTNDVMKGASQVTFSYLNSLFMYQPCNNFLHTHIKIYLLPLFLQQQLCGLSVVPFEE